MSSSNISRQLYRSARLEKKSTSPENEQIIARDPKYAFLYAYNILKSRFPIGESSISSNPTYRKIYEICFGKITNAPNIFENQISNVMEASDNEMTPIDIVRDTVQDFFDKLEDKFHFDIDEAGISVKKVNIANKIKKFAINYFQNSKLSEDWKRLFIERMEHTANTMPLHVFMVLQHWASLYNVE